MFNRLSYPGALMVGHFKPFLNPLLWECRLQASSSLTGPQRHRQLPRRGPEPHAPTLAPCSPCQAPVSAQPMAEWGVRPNQLECAVLLRENLGPEKKSHLPRGLLNCAFWRPVSRSSACRFTYTSVLVLLACKLLKNRWSTLWWM